MAAMRRALIAGESWTVHSTIRRVSTASRPWSMRRAFAGFAVPWQVDYQPSHIAARDFPFDGKALSRHGRVTHRCGGNWRPGCPAADRRYQVG